MFLLTKFLFAFYFTTSADIGNRDLRGYLVQFHPIQYSTYILISAQVFTEFPPQT